MIAHPQHKEMNAVLPFLIAVELLRGVSET